MPLTPEDVVNKRFQPTKFREGYDQDEVDDFLDEVVVELRRLSQENDELHKRLETAESAAAGQGARSADAAADQTSGSAGTDLIVDAVVADPSAVPEPAESPETPDDRDDDLAVHHDASDESAAIEPPTDRTEAAVLLDADHEVPDDASADSSSGLLRLARRLHDEHVREGVEKRDALIADGDEAKARAIAEGEALRERVLLDAEAARAQVVADAEAVRERVVADGHLEVDRVLAELGEKQRELVASLEAERGDLEEQVEALQEFEREYRDQLRSYIEGQLRELDATDAPEASDDAGAYDASDTTGDLVAADVIGAAEEPEPAGEFDAAEEFGAPDGASDDGTASDGDAAASSSSGAR
jgi:DivIVA domain-containing protein